MANNTFSFPSNGIKKEPLEDTAGLFPFASLRPGLKRTADEAGKLNASPSFEIRRSSVPAFGAVSALGSLSAFCAPKENHEHQVRPFSSKPPACSPPTVIPPFYDEVDKVMQIQASKQSATNQTKAALEKAEKDVQTLKLKLIEDKQNTFEAQKACFVTMNSISRDTLLRFIADKAPKEDIIDLLVKDMDGKRFFNRLVEHVPREALLGYMFEKVSREEAQECAKRLVTKDWDPNIMAPDVQEQEQGNATEVALDDRPGFPALGSEEHVDPVWLPNVPKKKPVVKLPGRRDASEDSANLASEQQCNMSKRVETGVWAERQKVEDGERPAKRLKV
jgi:hypothetical protein